MFQSLQKIGLLLGPLAAIALFLSLPDQYVDTQKALIPLDFPAKATLCVTLWMAIWWLSEALDITVTALLPIAIFPLLGIADIKTTTAPYASHLIFLFMGGFLIALSMQRWRLDQRIAGAILAQTGSNPLLLIAGFMTATALLSAFISNTATTALMLPMGLSIIALFTRVDGQGFTHPDQHNFARCLLLCIAYAASVGGTGTIIGTAPNLVLIGFLESGIDDQYQTQISFAEWTMMAAPLIFIFLPIIWLVLTRWVFPFKRENLLDPCLDTIHENARSHMSRGERATLIIFLTAVILWMTRPWLQTLTLPLPDGDIQPFKGLSDPGIAMLCALLLFIIPINFKQHSFVMDWPTAKKLPWGIFILFGGGLTLAQAIKNNGVAEFIASQSLYLPALPEYVFIFIICGAVILLTELTSNTATTATLVPILASITIGMGVHPYLIIFPATFAASFAFMMPIATPPNAIVFGSGHLSIPDMCRAGLWLNLFGVCLITALTYLVIKPALNI
jgi:sodium-dependent dicarboxylate transporter 2/3/5